MEATLYEAWRLTLRHLAPENARRWLYLLAHDAKRWQKVSPMMVWPSRDVERMFPDDLVHRLQALLASPMAARDVVVLNSHIGECYRARLDAVLQLVAILGKAGQYDVRLALMEGFICIVPGKLALLCNHEGGVALWENRKQAA